MIVFEEGKLLKRFHTHIANRRHIIDGGLGWEDHPQNGVALEFSQ